MAKDLASRVVENWKPLGFDTHDPEAIADFSLGLGYEPEDVVNTLVKRCNLDRMTARRIVESVRTTQQEGGR